MSILTTNEPQHKERLTLFADVIVPVSIPKLFTYRVPFEFNQFVAPGKRVIIQFGHRKILTGVIRHLHEIPPNSYEAKYLLDILDGKPAILPSQLKLIDWCAAYYMSTPGDVLTNMLPSGLKLSSQSFIQQNPDFNLSESSYTFSHKELLLLEALSTNELLSYAEAASLAAVKNVFVLIKSLIKKEAVLLIEQVKDKYRPKKIRRVKLKAVYANQQALQEVFHELSRKPKQTDILLYYLKEVPVYQQPELNENGIKKALITEAGLSAHSLKTLLKNGIIEEFYQNISRIEKLPHSGTNQIELSDKQKSAFNQVLDVFEQKDVALLHGVTGSGKTAVYIKLIQNAIESGGQVLYLLPEIALTTQIVKRLIHVFGNRLGVYHSKYSDNERVEVWQQLLAQEYDIVVGVRSSVFLPFSHLSLVIVDEEHEISYKQFEQAPRYNARDTAIILSKFHQAKVLLGSATPSFESYNNAKKGKYGYVTLTERFGHAVLPTVRTANLSEGRKKKTLRGEFTSILMTGLEKTLENKKQAIIFQNRRGYSPFLHCDECAHVPKCQNCAVSLTYHMQGNQLRCHYCGYKETTPRQCAACGSSRIRAVGFGTEKLEENLRLLIPHAVVERMDLDTTRNKYGYQQLIDGFEQGKIDILVGTQMVTKGLDFDHVHLVGVIDLDSMLHFPDFRSSERCFQLVTQVSGRAGRRNQPGEVIIQTTNPFHSIIEHLKTQDFVDFYQSEIGERVKYKYPPFFRLIKIIFKNKDHDLATKAASKIAQALKGKLGNRVLGPKEPFVNKIRNQFHIELLIKLEKSKINLSDAKEYLKETVSTLNTDKELRSTIAVFDVDPL